MAYWVSKVSKRTVLPLQALDLGGLLAVLSPLFTVHCGKHYTLKFFANPFL